MRTDRSIKRHWMLGFCVMFCLVVLPGCQDKAAVLDAGEVAERIQQRYERDFHLLPMSKQRHYAQRLYRLTGSEAYLEINQQYADQVLSRLRQDLDALAEDAAFLDQTVTAALARYPLRSERQRQRYHLLSQREDLIFASRLLFRLTQVRYYGLEAELTPVQWQTARTYLSSRPFQSWVTHPDMLERYTAQTANWVWFLHELEFLDLRSEYVQAFQAHFPSERDPYLNQAALRNKLYGLTHIVIAASRYYQQAVSAEEFAWVLEAFRALDQRILREATEDIYTEVGISLRLMGQQDEPLLAKIEAALIQAFDPEANLIPSPQGSLSLVSGQHRNVLAILLLKWPEALHPGPRLATLRSSEP